MNKLKGTQMPLNKVIEMCNVYDYGLQHDAGLFLKAITDIIYVLGISENELIDILNKELAA